MREHSINSLNDFVAGWYIEDDPLFDDVIDWFSKNPNVQQSMVMYEGELKYMPDFRDTLEYALHMNTDLFERYHKGLSSVIVKYIEKYPLCKGSQPWTVTEWTKVQQCLPGKAFFKTHCERSSAVPPFSNRHLVFMTYLNTVHDGGETEFVHQNIRVKPERGLTLIWPTDWTFSHRGLPAPTENKYIITGWFSYVL